MSQVALWNQKARPEVVVWDYHVLLLLRSKNLNMEHSSSSPGSDWIYDMDTMLRLPCEAKGSVLRSIGLMTVLRLVILVHLLQTISDRPFYLARIHIRGSTRIHCHCIHTSLTVSSFFGSFFRVIPAPVFLKEFASDRSHMVSSARAPLRRPCLTDALTAYIPFYFQEWRRLYTNA